MAIMRWECYAVLSTSFNVFIYVLFKRCPGRRDGGKLMAESIAKVVLYYQNR